MILAFTEIFFWNADTFLEWIHISSLPNINRLSLLTWSRLINFAITLINRHGNFKQLVHSRWKNVCWLQKVFGLKLKNRVLTTVLTLCPGLAPCPGPLLSGWPLARWPCEEGGGVGNGEEDVGLVVGDDELEGDPGFRARGDGGQGRRCPGDHFLYYEILSLSW